MALSHFFPFSPIFFAKCHASTPAPPEARGNSANSSKVPVADFPGYRVKITCINFLSKDTHVRGEVCYKYAHYVRAKWQPQPQRTNHPPPTCPPPPFHPHKAHHPPPRHSSFTSDNCSIYYCILCGHKTWQASLPSFRGFCCMYL